MASVNGDETSRDESWRKHHGDFVEHMAEERLKDATLKQNRQQMEQLLQDDLFSGDKDRYEQNKKEEDDKRGKERRNKNNYYAQDYRRVRMSKRGQLVWDACQMLEIMDARQRLTEIVEEGDFEAIYREVDRLRDTSLRPHLMFDTTQAESRADQLRREHKSRGKHPVVLMDQAAMSELRRFHNPPEAVKQMMKGVFLLLGEDEVTTSDWKACVRMCNPHGQNGMNRRLLEHDSTKVHPEVAARSKEILDKYSLDQIRKVSSGASAFYIWAYGVVDACDGNQVKGAEENEKLQPLTNPDGSIKPADTKRQREIFGRKPPPSPEWRRKQQRRYYRPTYQTQDDHDGLTTGRQSRDSDL